MVASRARQMGKGVGRVSRVKRVMRQPSVGVAALLCVPLGACEPLAEGTDTCISVEGCEPDGGFGGTEGDQPVGDPRWSCLPTGEPVMAPMTPAPPVVLYAVPIVDFTLPDPKGPPPNLTIRVGPSSDPTCSEVGPIPAPAAIHPLGENPEAVFGVLVPYGLDGYVHLEAPGYMPTEYYFGGPMIGSPAGLTVDLPLAAGMPPVTVPLV